MATEEEIYNMAVSLGKTGVAANLKEALDLAKMLLEHQEEKQKLKDELKQKEQQEQKMKNFELPPVRLGVEGEIDLTKSLSELLAEPEQKEQPAEQPAPSPSSQPSPAPQQSAVPQTPVPQPAKVSQPAAPETPDLFTAFSKKP